MPHLCSPSPSWFRQYFNEQGYQFIHTCLEHIQGVPPILSDEEQGNLLRGNWQLFGCGLRSVVQVYYKALKDSFSNKFSLFNLKSIKEDTKKVAHRKKITKMQNNIVKVLYWAQKLQFWTILFYDKLCIKVEVLWEGDKNFAKSPP